MRFGGWRHCPRCTTWLLGTTAAAPEEFAAVLWIYGLVIDGAVDFVLLNTADKPGST